MSKGQSFEEKSPKCSFDLCFGGDCCTALLTYPQLFVQKQHCLSLIEGQTSMYEKGCRPSKLSDSGVSHRKTTNLFLVTTTNSQGEKTIIANGEKYATHIENQIRSENNMALRVHYLGGPLDLVRIGGTQLIDKNARSLYYSRTNSISIQRIGPDLTKENVEFEFEERYDYRKENPHE